MDGILKSLLLLHAPEDIVEIRSIGPKPTISGYFRADSPNIEKEIARYPGRTFYQTMNCVNPGCYARGQHEALLANPGETTSDRDILGYGWILIDADPVRPSGVSATDAEKASAFRVAKAVFTHLRKLGFRDPIVADSGNGYHLLYRIRAELGSRDDVSAFLKVLDTWFSTDEVLIDTAVFNPARITKLYGTIARKGANTPERPHRMSRILHVPEEIGTTPMALVREVAANAEKRISPSGSSARGTGEAFDMDAFLSNHQIEVAKKTAIPSGTKYLLKECPFNCEHKAPDAAVFVGRDGRLGFHCFHNSCSEYGWHEFRAKVDPQAYRGSVFQPRSLDAAVPKMPAPAPGKRAPAMLDIADVEDYDRGKIITIRSRLGKLDDLIGGFNKGELSVWSGSNSSGKSTLVSQLGLEAVHQGYKVALFSGEMPPKLVKYWLYLQAAGPDMVEPDPLSPRHYKLKDGVKEQLSQKLSGSFAVYNNNFGNDWEMVSKVIFDWVKQKKSDVVIIDNLMALNLSAGVRDKYEIQTRIVQTLSAAAKQLNVHVHFICHPRKTESFLRKEDISGTGDLTNTADNVFMVHRVNSDFLTRVKEFYPELTIPDGVGNAVEIMKNRDLGVVDEIVPLYFDKTCKTMSDVKGSPRRFGWSEGFIPVDKPGDPDFPF